MTSRIDELRGLYPNLGFALYAMVPGGRVTFEVYDGDDVFSFSGTTADEAIDTAFPLIIEDKHISHNVFE